MSNASKMTQPEMHRSKSTISQATREKIDKLTEHMKQVKIVSKKAI